MQFTKEQEQAIYTSGNNLLVSAGAGSRKDCSSCRKNNK